MRYPECHLRPGLMIGGAEILIVAGETTVLSPERVPGSDGSCASLNPPLNAANPKESE